MIESTRNSLIRISALGVDGGVLFFFLECPGENFLFLVYKTSILCILQGYHFKR